jgi:hypothetical protein
MYQLTTHVIDFDKVNTIDDIKVILKNLRLSFDRPDDDLKNLCNHVYKENGLPVKHD